MAFNKKPIGSEELDAYGVWVKSEPQDLTASLAGVVNFDAEAVTYEEDYDTGFDGLGVSDISIGNLEQDIPQVSAESYEIDKGGVNIDDDIAADIGRNSEEASTQLLMKIASELSSIRAELSTLKKEFADIRAESAAGVKAETRHAGFFPEDEDEKIALTGDEMENFFTSNDFTEAELKYDPLREADEAALKELSVQNEAPVFDEAVEEPAGEANLEFSDIGIGLEHEIVEAHEEFPPLEDSVPFEDGVSLEDSASFEDSVSLESSASIDDFDEIRSDALSYEELAALEKVEHHEEDVQEIVEEFAPLEPLDEDEELKALRMEGASPLIPAPEDSNYLESDSFSLDSSDFEGTPLEGDTNENIQFDYTPEETVPEATGDVHFDDGNFDTGFENLLAEDANSEAGEALDLSDVIIDEPAVSPDPAEAPVDEPSMDLGSFDPDDVVIDEPDAGFPDLGEEAIAEQDIDIGSLDVSEAVVDEQELSAETAIPPLEEPVADDISFDDELAFEVEDIEAKMDDFSAGIDLDADDSEVKSKAEGSVAGYDDSFAQVIPEGFEINAQEAAVSFDDDLEALVEDDLPVETDEAKPPDAVVKTDEAAGDDPDISAGMKSDLKNVLQYMDHLLESLPEDKIEEFAKSEYFDSYKKIFKDLGLV
ncbi:MAG: hypothetical protein FWC24_02940 [Treponema sp.]|nr:hypothetical protein [Treponema sp.]